MSLCPMCMGLVCLLVHSQLRYHYTLKAQHVRGDQNNVADALSHFQETRFQDLCPWAASAPTLPPQFLWPLSRDIWTHYYQSALGQEPGKSITQQSEVSISSWMGGT